MKEKIEEATGLGPGGNCVCPQCSYNIPHERGQPCVRQKCPKCGNFMVRENNIPLIKEGGKNDRRA
jgi:hypothetical protein